MTPESKELLDSYARFAIKWGRAEAGSRVEANAETQMIKAREALIERIEFLERNQAPADYSNVGFNCDH